MPHTKLKAKQLIRKSSIWECQLSSEIRNVSLIVFNVINLWLSSFLIVAVYELFCCGHNESFDALHMWFVNFVYSRAVMVSVHSQHRCQWSHDRHPSVRILRRLHLTRDLDHFDANMLLRSHCWSAEHAKWWIAFLLQVWVELFRYSDGLVIPISVSISVQPHPIVSGIRRQHGIGLTLAMTPSNHTITLSMHMPIIAYFIMLNNKGRLNLSLDWHYLRDIIICPAFSTLYFH